jgi:hypothetical protein
MKPKRSKPRRHQRHTAERTAGWETQFRNAFDHLFDPAVERLNAVLEGRLSSARYYGIVAILHDLALAHTETLTGVRKLPREKLIPGSK